MESTANTVATDYVVDPLLTSAEAALLLDASEPTLWRWVRQRRLPPPIKLGHLSRWPRSEIVGVIEKAKAARFETQPHSVVTVKAGVAA